MSNRPVHEIPRKATHGDYVGTVEGADFYSLTLGGEQVAIIANANGPVATYGEAINWNEVIARINE